MAGMQIITTIHEPNSGAKSIKQSSYEILITGLSIKSSWSSVLKRKESLNQRGFLWNAMKLLDKSGFGPIFTLARSGRKPNLIALIKLELLYKGFGSCT